MTHRRGGRLSRWLTAGALGVLLLGRGVQAAPLEEKDRTGQEALQILRERGLLEGYSKTGELKGDRALSRWEMAMILARFLSLAQTRSLDFLSKPERDAVEKALLDLEPELTGLGVRVTNVEAKADLLDQRVTELERLHVRGTFISSFNTLHFTNTGQPYGGANATGINYDSAVGTLLTSNLVPHSPSGIIPSVNMITGRPLVNGEGLSSTFLLDVETEPAAGWLVTARFYAYSSQGNSIVDQVYGSPAPYLANSFTGQVNHNAEGSDHVPFTSMGIDRVRLVHEESGTTLTLGTFNPRFISGQVYTGEVNPSIGDPRFLESYGVQATGEIKLSKNSLLGWEVLGTQLPDGNPVQKGFSPYSDVAYGGALSYKNGNFTAGLSFLNAASQASDGQPLVVGLSNLVNGGTGQVNVNWVNPPQYFASQLQTSGSAGIGSTTDKRPIPGIAGSDMGGTAAGFGPQAIVLGGGQLSYRTDDWSLHGEWDHSSYRPNRDSGYTSEGSLYSLGGGLQLFDSKVLVDLDYRHTDPTYDPMILVYPGTAAGVNPFRVYHRFPDFDEFWHLYALHDTVQYPHNREGLVAAIKWAYDDSSSLRFTYRDQSQVRTSLQDVRYNANELAPGLPSVKVLGFSPGFIDVVFREFSPLSFDSKLNPMENPRGSLQSFGVDWQHQFGEGPFDLEMRYEQYHFYRPSALAPTFGGSQNMVDLLASTAHARLGYRPSKDWGLGAGYEFGSQHGHYDPFGVYNPYAIATGSTTFLNRDTIQHQPFVDASYTVAEGVKVTGDFRLFSSVDHVPATVFAGTAGGPTSTAHPFSYDGYSISTRLEINF